MPSPITVRSIQGDTVDLVCWRHYGKTREVTEQVMAANLFLADLDIILPLGTELSLPVVEEKIDDNSLVRLWDD